MAETNTNYSNLTPEQIEQELAALSAEKDAIRETMRELTAARDEAQAQITARQKLANMTAAERRVLGLPDPTPEEAQEVAEQENKPKAQTVSKAGGIDSKESVSGPR